ncbi:hypothetical protein HK096_010243, partial [Nowakowskiella sp. JEL0078]
FGKSYLWHLFSLDKFNSILKTVGNFEHPVLDDELFPNDSNTLPSIYDSTLINIDFDFGASSVGSKPSIVHINLHNSGVVPVEWMFHFPNDLEVEIEHWADPGDYTEEQIHHNMIVDNSLFTIQPKRGCLHPGEAAHIILTYTHEFPGLHKLPVLFRLKDELSSSSTAKEVLVTFHGYSVAPTKKYIHFHNDAHEFRTVTIGNPKPPIQYYQLINRGSISLQYMIDMNPLELLKTENHSYPILECLKTQGIISPGQTDFVGFIFSPLEAKKYEIDVPINIIDGKNKIITFKGSGVHEMYDENFETHFGQIELEDAIPAVQQLQISTQIAYLSM